MANMLRDWLGKFLDDQISNAVQWKRTDLERSKLPRIKKERTEADHDGTVDGKDDDDNDDDDYDLYNDNGSRILIHVERGRSKGDNSFLQFIKFVRYAPPYTCLLSDGHTSIQANITDDAVRKFEQDNAMRISQIEGGIVHAAAFDIVVTGYGSNTVSLDLKAFRYRKGTMGGGMVGHPQIVTARPSIQESVDEIGRLHLPTDDDDDDVPAVEDVPSQTKNAKETLPVEEENDDLPLSQPNTQAIFTTQVTKKIIRNRAPRPTRDVSIAQGTNLAPPVSLSRQSQQFQRPNTAAADVLRMIGRAYVQPQPVPVRELPLARDIQRSPQLRSGNPSSQTPNELLVANMVEERPHKADRIVVEILDDSSQSSSRSDKVEAVEQLGVPTLQATLPKFVDVEQTMQIDLPSNDNVNSRRPDPKYIMYARRSVDDNQRNLLGRKSSWLPPEIGLRAVPSNIPVDLLRELSKRAANDNRNIYLEENDQSRREPTSRETIQSTNGEKADIEALNDEDEDEDEDDEKLPWSSSPVRCETSLQTRHHNGGMLLGRSGMPIKGLAKGELPPDSSADFHKSPHEDARLPESSAGTAPPSSPPVEAEAEESPEEQDMDIDSDSDGSELAQTVPRQLPAPDHRFPTDEVIRGSPVNVPSTANNFKTPVSTDLSIVVDSTERQNQRSIQSITEPRTPAIPSRQKRPLETEQDASVKMRKIRATPITWGEDELVNEDPAVKLNREKSERLRRERHEAAGYHIPVHPASPQDLQRPSHRAPLPSQESAFSGHHHRPVKLRPDEPDLRGTSGTNAFSMADNYRPAHDRIRSSSSQADNNNNHKAHHLTPKLADKRESTLTHHRQRPAPPPRPSSQPFRTLDAAYAPKLSASALRPETPQVTGSHVSAFQREGQAPISTRQNGTPGVVQPRGLLSQNKRMTSTQPSSQPFRTLDAAYAPKLARPEEASRVIDSHAQPVQSLRVERTPTLTSHTPRVNTSNATHQVGRGTPNHPRSHHGTPTSSHRPSPFGHRDTTSRRPTGPRSAMGPPSFPSSSSRRTSAMQVSPPTVKELPRDMPMRRFRAEFEMLKKVQSERNMHDANGKGRIQVLGWKL